MKVNLFNIFSHYLMLKYSIAHVRTFKFVIFVCFVFTKHHMDRLYTYGASFIKHAYVQIWS